MQVLVIDLTLIIEEYKEADDLQSRPFFLPITV